MKPSRIIISRTDSIGDVILTLPMAGVLKEKFPDCKILFLGRSYTEDIINASEHIDEFINWNKIKDQDESRQVEAFREMKADLFIHVFPVKKIAMIACKSRIPTRLGTTNRLYHLHTCNKLVRMTRRRSPLHEAQLNLRLIGKLTGKPVFRLDEIPAYYGLSNIEPLNDEYKKLLDSKRFNLILHPKSKGSAREWGIDNFEGLVRILPSEKFKIFITGTAEEGQLLSKSELAREDRDLVNMTGKFSLPQLISFISGADGLVAASTGPLHLAAALGKHAIGIYPPIRPMHPGRWAPLGSNATWSVLDKKCNDCRKSGDCHCIREITPESIARKLQELV